MPRNMSFFLTTQQMRDRTKTVTRRLGWKFAKSGDVINACVKCQGLKAGETVEGICQIVVTSVRFEPLNRIYDEGPRGCSLEGFPEMSPREFVTMFCDAMKCRPAEQVTRIEFEFME